MTDTVYDMVILGAGSGGYAAALRGAQLGLKVALVEAGSGEVAATGARFRHEILARGGSRPAGENFRAFRGRAPRIDALMRRPEVARDLRPADGEEAGEEKEQP